MVTVYVYRTYPAKERTGCLQEKIASDVIGHLDLP